MNMRSAYLDLKVPRREGVEAHSNFKSGGSDEYLLMSFPYSGIVVF